MEDKKWSSYAPDRKHHPSLQSECDNANIVNSIKGIVSSKEKEAFSNRRSNLDMRQNDHLQKTAQLEIEQGTHFQNQNYIQQVANSEVSSTHNETQIHNFNQSLESKHASMYHNEDDQKHSSKDVEQSNFPNKNTKFREISSRRKRSWKSYLAILLCGFVVFFGFLIFGVPYILPSESIAREISRQVRLATGWHLKIDGPIAIRILPNAQFRASGVSISNDGDKPFIYTDSLRFGINISAIFTGQVQLNELIFVGTKVNLVEDEAGRMNWLVTNSQSNLEITNSSQSQSVNLFDNITKLRNSGSVLQALERLQISTIKLYNGELQYQNLKNNNNIKLQNIELSTGVISLSDALNLSGSFQYKDKEFNINAALDNPQAAILDSQSTIQASLESDVVTITWGGAIDFALGPAFGGELVVTITSLHQMANWLGIKTTDTSQNLNEINLTAEIAASPQLIDIAGFNLKIGQESLNGIVKFDLTRVETFISGRIFSEGLNIPALMSISGFDSRNILLTKGLLIGDVQFAAIGNTIDSLLASLNARGTLGVRSGVIEGTGLGILLSENNADTISQISANLTINSLDAPIGLVGQANWREEELTLSGQIGIGRFLSNGMGPMQIALNSSYVSGGFNGTFTQTGDFDGSITIETRSLRNFLLWLNQPVTRSSGLGPFSYEGRLSLGTQALNFDDARILIDGTIGRGSGRIDFSEKPMITAQFALDVLDITPYVLTSQSHQQTNLSSSESLPGVAGAARVNWSEAPIEFSALNTIDARLNLQAREVRWGTLRAGQSQLDVNLIGGILTADLNQMQLYQGRGAGRIIVDASSDVPHIKVNFDLASLRALPFLQDAFGFARIEGLADFSLALTSFGRSEKALISRLDGEARIFFRNGSIRGISIPNIVRTLSARTLLGWQVNGRDKTDFTELSGSFEVNNGLARTRDIRLQGPLVNVTGAGFVDLPAKTLEMRFDPRLAASQQDQEGRQTFIGLGVPIVVDGALDQPRIYPDIAGILENPDAAFTQLRQLGRGLAAITDDGDALRQTVREQIQQQTGVNVNGIIQNGRIDRDRAINEGTNLIGRLIDGRQGDNLESVNPRRIESNQQNLSGVPIPRLDPRGTLQPSTSQQTVPRFMTPEEARRATDGRTTINSAPSGSTPVIPNSPPATAPSPNRGGPIDLLDLNTNPGPRPVAPGTGNSPPPSNPVDGLLRGIFGR